MVAAVLVGLSMMLAAHHPANKSPVATHHDKGLITSRR